MNSENNLILSAIVPVYNEEEAIVKTLNDLKRVLFSLGISYEIIVVNDASTDNSRELIKQIEEVKLIDHPYNLGYGASLKSGLKIAQGEFILITDADGTYPLDFIPQLFAESKNYDMVVGARRGEKVDIPFLRRPAKWLITFLANILTGRKISDLNSGLRIFKKEKALEFLHLYPQKFSFTTTITLAFLSEGYTVKFLPINYHKRSGKSSIKPLNDFVNFLALIIRVMVYFRPFRMFALLSLLMLIIAIIVAVGSVYFLRRFMDISFIVIVLAAIQIFVSGLIAELIIRTRR
jgi:glycosyltransferase involved in cell wall biosynthesis